MAQLFETVSRIYGSRSVTNDDGKTPDLLFYRTVDVSLIVGTYVYEILIRPLPHDDDIATEHTIAVYAPSEGGVSWE